MKVQLPSAALVVAAAPPHKCGAAAIGDAGSANGLQVAEIHVDASDGLESRPNLVPSTLAKAQPRASSGSVASAASGAAQQQMQSAAGAETAGMRGCMCFGHHGNSKHTQEIAAAGELKLYLD